MARENTLIKLLLNKNKPAQGEIKILGQDINKFTRWDKIGYVSQRATSFNTSFPATVKEVRALIFSRVGLFKRLKKNTGNGFAML